jgi:hypothetical protein
MSLNQSKKLLWPVLALLLLAACTQMESFHEDDSQNQGDVSASVSSDLIQPLIDQYVTEGHFWLVSKDPIPPKTVLKYGPFGHYDPASEYCGTIQSPDFTAWLVYISGDTRIDGPAPDALCLFIDVATGEYVKIPINGQISGIEWDPAFYEITENPFEGQETKASSGSTASPQARAAVAKHYAVIISGGANMENNHSRYWNNCQYIYKRLTQDLGYDKSHIYCAVADGTNPAPDMRYAYNPYTNTSYFTTSPLDFDNDGTNDIKYAATKYDITRIFNELKSKLSSIDHLLVFVTDHGSRDGKICLWNDQRMSPAELNAELNKLPNVKMDIVMGQCYSGAFVIPLTVAKNRTIATACTANETANSEGEFSYGFFLRAWTDAFDPTKTSTVNTNGDDMVSLWEAFNYAKSHDTAAVYGDEHPQFKTNPVYYGYLHDLQGVHYDPVITGSDNIRVNDVFTYTISGLPASTSVRWSGIGEISLSAQTNTSVKVQSTLPTNEYVSSYPTALMAYFTYNGTELWASKDIFSNWRSGYFQNVNKIFYTADGDYTVYTGYGAYGYQWGSNNSSWTFFPPSGSSHVQITGNYPTSGMVYVVFKNPFGDTVTVGQEIQLRNW